MPKKRAARNRKGILLSLNDLILIDLIASIKGVYIPIIKAMVPPEIPGTRSAAPMHSPVKNTRKKTSTLLNL